MSSTSKPKFSLHARRYFFAGLLVWLPIWVTVIIIKFVIDLLDNILLLIPAEYRPDSLVGFHIPAMGVIITFIVIILTGLIVTNFLGRHLVLFWEAIVNRIPLVRTIHAGVKQILETLFSPSGNSFKKVLLVEYPKEGMWTIAFQTGDTTPEIEADLKISGLVSVFVPMTPNITAGFLLVMPSTKVIELSMTVEQAFKYIISLGVIIPPTKPNVEPTIPSLNT
jgi:uncharacterized membrane protein